MCDSTRTGTALCLFFLNEPDRRAADYIKKKIKTQIEQYNKKKNATTQHQTSQQTYHTTQHTPPNMKLKIQTIRTSLVVLVLVYIAVAWTEQNHKQVEFLGPWKASAKDSSRQHRPKAS